MTVNPNTPSVAMAPVAADPYPTVAVFNVIRPANVIGTVFDCDDYTRWRRGRTVVRRRRTGAEQRDQAKQENEPAFHNDILCMGGTMPIPRLFVLKNAVGLIPALAVVRPGAQ